MVKDAEAHAEEDRKFRELVDTRNKADALMHATEKTLKDLGDKVPGGERAKIESAMSDLKTALAATTRRSSIRRLSVGTSICDACSGSAGASGAGEPAGAQSGPARPRETARRCAGRGIRRGEG